MDKRNKIRYLNMNQDKLEKKLLQEFEKNQTNRPKIPREGQNPYQHLTTFNNLIGYFVEKTSPYDNLFTWTQHHQKFTKFNIPYQFENEYKEGGNKYYTCNKIKNQEDFNNGMTGCFEGVDLVGINNVSDLVINNKFIENIRKNTEISKIIDDDSNLSINKNKKKKSSILEKKNTNLNKIPIIIQTPRINTEGNIDKTKTMIRQHAKNLILSEGLIKHRKIFNLNKLKENQLNLDLFKTSRKKNKTEGDFFNNNKNKIGKNLFLNPFDMKNYSINKILSNANDQSLNTFMQQRIKNLKKLKIKQKKKNLNIAINLSINTNNNSPTQMKSSKKFSNVNDESSDLKSKNSKFFLFIFF